MIRRVLRRSVALVPWPLRQAIRRMPLLAGAQRWLLARFLEGREFTHTVDAGPARGLRYPVTLPADKGIWTGTYELDLARAIAAAVQPGDVCFDIGGWHGFFAGVMALRGAKHVVVFEPLPANIAQLRKMLALNDSLPITVVEAAVADRDGELEFVVMPETSMGKLSASSFQQSRNGTRMHVRAVALDALIARGEASVPAVMKIDVEGAEMFVLAGARNLLAMHRPTLFIEAHSPALRRECQSFLEDLGYVVRVAEQPGRDVSHIHAARG